MLWEFLSHSNLSSFFENFELVRQRKSVVRPITVGKGVGGVGLESEG
jgi:hypothetical protein